MTLRLFSKGLFPYDVDAGSVFGILVGYRVVCANFSSFSCSFVGSMVERWRNAERQV